jgi:hypothetical protein
MAAAGDDCDQQVEPLEAQIQRGRGGSSMSPPTGASAAGFRGCSAMLLCYNRSTSWIAEGSP